MDKEISRLGIFVFFDPEGIVDDYVLYMLDSLRPNVKKLVAVCNGFVNREGRNKLERYCDTVFVRENRGLDAAAFKEAMVQFLGWEEVDAYDELVLLNDTFFGPIGDTFDNIFHTMQKLDVDFWGLSCGYPATDGYGVMAEGYLPAHVQTFFVVFRKQMVNSHAFHDYWYRYDDTMSDFVSVVTKHELIMTTHFEKQGFRWAVYAETEDYHSSLISENFTMYHSRTNQLLRRMRFPFIKKKPFSISMPDYLYMCDLEETADAMAYIENETDYDSNLIWQNILRRYNTLDLYHSLHLSYVLPSATADNVPMDEAAIICFLTNTKTLHFVQNHLEPIAEIIDVYLILEGEVQEQTDWERLEKKHFHIIRSDIHQNQAMAAFVLYGKDLADNYRYLGFIHDCENPRHVPLSVPESETYGYLENVAANIPYITQVLRLFENNKRLGVLGTPFPHHQDLFAHYGNLWGGWYSATKGLTDELELDCQIDEGKNPLTLTGAFWCRTAAVQALWRTDWRRKSFYRDPVSGSCPIDEALKRVLPFAAQNEGYYSGIVMSCNYASMRLTTQEYMLDTIVSTTKRKLNCNAPYLAGYLNQLNNVVPAGTETVLNQPNTIIGVRGALGNYVNKKMPGKLGSALIKTFHLS